MTSKELQETLSMPDRLPQNLPVLITYYCDNKPVFLHIKHIYRTASRSGLIPGIPQGSSYCSIEAEPWRPPALVSHETEQIEYQLIDTVADWERQKAEHAIKYRNALRFCVWDTLDRWLSYLKQHAVIAETDQRLSEEQERLVRYQLAAS